MTKISLEGIELDRLLILEQVKNRQLTQEEAGKRLNPKFPPKIIPT